jgi:hypothetical protein
MHTDLPFGLAGKHDADIGRPSDEFAVRRLEAPMTQRGGISEELAYMAACVARDSLAGSV